MVDLLNAYVDQNFLEQVVQLSPAIGAGVILGIIFAVIGWTFGLVIRLGKLDF